MNKEQYDECNKYRGIIELFVSSGQYVGGADGLFDYYGMPKQERSCPSCLSRFILERDNDIKNYEGKALIATNLALYIEQNLKNDSNL